MAIVIEGLDNTGKSTLAAKLSSMLNLKVKESEGPPSSPEELIDRVERYRQMEDTIFVRHPCVSHNIYNIVRPKFFVLDVGEFYHQDHTFIYCAHGENTRHHIAKAHEDPAFVARVNEHTAELLELYDDWALNHAHIIYRVGDDVGRIGGWLSTL